MITKKDLKFSIKKMENIIMEFDDVVKRIENKGEKVIEQRLSLAILQARNFKDVFGKAVELMNELKNGSKDKK